MNPVVMRGAAKGLSTVAIDYVGEDFDPRQGGARKKRSRDCRYDLTFKVTVGEVTLRLHAQMETRSFELANPDTGKPGFYWDVPIIWLWATDLELPMGYDIWVTPKPMRVTERTRGENTFPDASILLETEVGPMIGTWTKYRHVLVIDAVGGKITM
jgi:hypothetical protein